MQKVSFYTLGCKLNQSETSFLQNEFVKRGYHIVPSGESCDICVINTCAVTARTEHKCRQLIRKVGKTSPAPIIAVVGCYAQIAPERVQAIPGVRLILGSDKKFDIFHYLENEPYLTGEHQAISENLQFFNAMPGKIKEQTRAFLKIQDGCNNFCSYCIVPYARGRSRSAPIAEVIAQIEQLIVDDYNEIVLTGVHIGTYGQDLTPSHLLLEILQRAENLNGLGRIRLSSLEPQEIDDALIDFIAQSNKICPHFHIPLQSGDDEIIKKMNRNYTVSQYIQIVEKIHQRMPDAGLGTDIIVGFPGETEQQFEDTYRLVQELPFSYLHVFPFSARPGTKAALFSNNINPEIKKNRSAKLIALGKLKKKHFYSQAIGRTCQVLFEKKDCRNWMQGFTENYIRVKIPVQAALFNRIVPVSITKVADDVASANLLI